MLDWDTHLKNGAWKDVNGLKAFYVSLGKGAAVVLIHGWASSSFTWRKIYSPLSNSFHVIAVDLPGFGNSQPLPGGLSLEAVGAHITVLMDKLMIDRFAVVGHSMGGVLASYLAATFPDRVWGTVLAAPGFMTVTDGRRPFFVELVRRRPIGRILAGMLVNRWFVGRALRNACYEKQAVTGEMVEGYLRSVKQHPLTLLDAFKLSEGFKMEMLEKITSPALMIWGSHDRWVPISIGHEISKTRGWDVRIIENAGHLPHEEKPGEFIQILHQFLAHISPREVKAD
jgi:pimeloyl-ACP methyl ester carboxylesterase